MRNLKILSGLFLVLVNLIGRHAVAQDPSQELWDLVKGGSKWAGEYIKWSGGAGFSKKIEAPPTIAFFSESVSDDYAIFLGNKEEDSYGNLRLNSIFVDTYEADVNPFSPWLGSAWWVRGTYTDPIKKPNGYKWIAVCAQQLNKLDIQSLERVLPKYKNSSGDCRWQDYEYKASRMFLVKSESLNEVNRWIEMTQQDFRRDMNGFYFGNNYEPQPKSSYWFIEQIHFKKTNPFRYSRTGIIVPTIAAIVFARYDYQRKFDAATPFYPRWVRKAEKIFAFE